MVTENYALVWTKRASNQMAAIYKYISEDSPKNALKVINEIVFAVEKAIRNPEFGVTAKMGLNQITDSH